MLYREIIAVCSEIHTEHINTLCGQNVELLNAKPDDIHTYIYIKQQLDSQINITVGNAIKYFFLAFLS